ncbi:methylated-DNA--[protein]-cysteine S-methyltransferase [Isoptericola sp. NEAU-Y5]|uniref:Methylated-DNA--[protein]-cysteine S-methyltransferase n=1 Tax=Isoptericola luteus TaxID=2879484 RepID=A0ABS7ZI66_9MICO|nr:methylated-DNA--[protein]-cysteine S-methyltransferase [Isoptericola sp. NEAU-Y5]MCA5894721.1 methylated-DNA--[protein]-cysteine S-methyltransferase [Isoptericola sp. NEAU-Y5]
METPLYATYATALGHGALVWDAAARIVGSTLPQPDADAARREVHGRHPGATPGRPSPDVVAVISAVRRLLDTGTDVEHLADVPLDLARVPEFDRRVYDVARAVPAGQTLTYGQVAARLGTPGAAQAVGRALGRNPFPPIVPCHRIIAAGRRPGGFSAPGGARTKLRMLAAEGVELEAPTLFDL